MYGKLAEREGLKFDDDLHTAFNRTRETRALRDALDWLAIGTASAYRVLAEDRWAEFADTVRRDLGDRFETFAEESRAQYSARLGAEVIQALETGGKTLVTFDDGVVRSIEAEVVEQFKDFFQGGDWNVRRFALAALAGVARNGEAEDAHVVRQWLDSEHSEVREAAVLALARTGTEDDVGKLLELTELEGRDVFGRAALSLSPPGSFATALALLDSSRAGVALLGARHLYSHVSQLPAEIFKLLLHHKTDSVRRVGVACALAQSDDSELEDLIDRYTSSERYFYNVVFWLDRAVLAPPYLRERTREDLATFASSERQPELPALRRETPRWLVEFLRSRTSA